MKQYQTRKTEVSPESLAIQHKHSENVLADLSGHMQANTPPASNKFIQNFKTMMQPFSQSQVHQLVLQHSGQSQKSLSSTHVDDLIQKIKRRVNLETDYITEPAIDQEETAMFLNSDSPSKEQPVSSYLDQQVSKYSAKNFFKKQPSTNQLDLQFTPQKQMHYPVILDESSDSQKNESMSARTPRPLNIAQSPSKQDTSTKKKVSRKIRSSMYLTHATETKEQPALQNHQPYYAKQILQSAMIQKQKQKLRTSQNTSLQMQLNDFKQSVIKRCALDLAPSPSANKINQPVTSPDTLKSQKRESSLQKRQQKSIQKSHTRQISTTLDFFEKQTFAIQKNLEVAISTTELAVQQDQESSPKLPQNSANAKRQGESKTRKTKVAVKHAFKPTLATNFASSNTLKTSCSSTIETLRPVASSLSNSSNQVLRNTINQLKPKEKLTAASTSVLQENLKGLVVDHAVKSQKKREASKTKKKEKKQEEQKVLPSQQLNINVSQTQPALQKQPSTTPQCNASNGWGMLDSEKLQFGDRCPKGYTKILLLGKGGIAVVWLATNELGQQVALKQFPKANSKSALDSSAGVEIEIARTIQESKSQVDESEFPGVKSIAKLLATIEDTKDNWLVYEVGSSSLSKHLFDVKGEFYKGERIYGVQHKSFYASLLLSKQALRDLIRLMAEVLDVLSYYSVVHADIKPDNILVDFDGSRIKNLKLIDFGSAFSYENPGNITASTPEYLAPEVLNYLENRGANTNHTNGTNSVKLCQMQEPWSYDVWSLGVILLELLTGIPIWMSLKCRTVTQTKKSQMATGIFAVQGRSGAKILLKQALVFKSLPQTLKKYECYGLNTDIQFMDLLQGMLEINPLKRISPKQVLCHPFVNSTS